MLRVSLLSKPIAIVLFTSLLLVIVSATKVLAHAELDTASPPVDGTVTSLPASISLIFTEEVKPGGVTIRVTGPGGERVDTGDAAVDLNDAERTRVNVSLYAGGPGTYSVVWETISNLDGDQASGNYVFTVAAGASPQPSIIGTPDSAAATVAVTATLDPEVNGNPLGSTENYDSRAFAISVGAGLLALALIVCFWLVVRPRNAKFGSRSRPEQD